VPKGLRHTAREVAGGQDLSLGEFVRQALMRAIKSAGAKATLSTGTRISMETFNSARQRAALVDFGKALGSRDSSLRRDECGDPRSNGRRGHIYAAPEGFILVIMGWSALGWGRAKRALAFARVSRDGDDEGILILDRLPTKTEAEAIGQYPGVAKRKEIGPEQQKTLQERARGWSKNPLAA
jgi:hypothetical protein